MSNPAKKEPASHKSARHASSPLQTLLQMGFAKHRALKALAATGNRSVQLASDWLLTHVNDPFIDDEVPREYILYACPTGPLHSLLSEFRNKSKQIIGWNGAHNFPPHITLVSFFKAPDEVSVHLAKAMKHVVEASEHSSTGPLVLEPYVSHNFMGLFVSEQQADYLKKIAINYVKEVSSESVSLEPHVKSLHITLAYHFEETAFEPLKMLVEEMKPLECSNWELRLYSRDPRFNKHRVHKVIRSYEPSEDDELQLVIGDFIYIEDSEFDNTDGWVHGTSWLTGVAGRLPAVNTERTLESDAWTQHRAISLTNNSSDSDSTADYEMASVTNEGKFGHEKSEESFKEWGAYWQILKDQPTVGTADLIQGGSMSLRNDAENEVDGVFRENGSNGLSECSRRWFFALRHGERVDLTYGDWTPHCFDQHGDYLRKDLNMPVSLPCRVGGAEAYKKDTPLTRVGHLQAYLVGEGLRLAGVSLTHVYASCALRCVETANSMLQGLQADPAVKIRVDPGLFEYTMWHKHNAPLQFMTPLELHKAGYNVDLDYKPYMEIDTDGCETLDDYYQRGEFVMHSAVKDTAQEGGNVMFVGHAATVDIMAVALTRLGQNTSAPHKYQLSKHLLRVPYCALGAFREKPWQMVAPPCPPSVNSSSGRFDWKLLKDCIDCL